jgi:hypothetical protein
MTTTNDASRSPGQTHHRKIHYIDHVLQKWLLISLVGLEVVVLSIGGAILYSRLNVIVDANLYRIHFADQPSMFSVLLKESVTILGWMGVANLVALVVADRIWAYYVNDILGTLRGLLSRTRDLDLGDDIDVPQRHNVVALALAWRHVERDRHLALHESLALVDRCAAQSSSRDEFRAALLALRQHLPPASG